MSKLSKSIKISFVFAVLFSWSAWAKSPLALVNSVKGNAFVIKENKQTYPLKPGDHLYDFDEVLTETGGQVSFSDYFDHQYHLSGSGQIRLLNKMVELKRGYLWQQVYSAQQNYMTQTANAVVHYSGGESIVSFDPYSGKTQLLVIKGLFEFSNLLQKYMKLEVSDGQFSFIDNEYEQGRPRSPTPLGYGSFKKVTGLFQGVEPMEKGRAFEKMKPRPTMNLPKRSIASVKSTNTEKKPQGEIIYLTRDKERLQKRQQALLLQYEKKVKKMSRPKKKAFKPSYAKKSQAKVHIFGQSFLKKSGMKKVVAKKPKPVKKPEVKKNGVEPVQKRAPASIPTEKPSTTGKKKTSRPSAFENSLIDAYKKQMRHGQETNSLIKELKNYKQDYKTSY